MKTLTKLSRKTLFKTLLTAFLAVLAGIVNGFLGTGGGIVLMFALALLPTTDDNAVRDRFAAVIAVILPLSLISTVSYGDSIDFRAAVPYLLPGILGGIVGALLLDRLNVKIIKKLFALMVIWAGISFMRG